MGLPIKHAYAHTTNRKPGEGEAGGGLHNGILRWICRPTVPFMTLSPTWYRAESSSRCMAMRVSKVELRPSTLRDNVFMVMLSASRCRSGDVDIVAVIFLWGWCCGALRQPSATSC